MPNRLASESSPYLLQHKDNPVDWYPWGPEALARARAEDKPMLVSIGYSACHWCHVMAHESFEDTAVAALMNEKLICIKVDREERPDIDSLCMTAVQAMTGQGGWPLNAFLTPEGVPFYGGTYFPPTDRQGMPSWRRVVDAVSETWRTKREEILAQGDQIREALAHQPHLETGLPEVDEDIIIRAVARLGSQFDNENGGFGAAPKFPQAPVLEFLLRAQHLLGDQSSLMMAVATLDQMAEGGLFDQIGGGFHRYAVDNIWLVPHFEKMLYDNAQLARCYTDAWRIEHNPAHRRIAELTLDYLLREMRSPEGAFYSAQDADSEGVEGKFYVWNPELLEDALSEADRERASTAYGITVEGNFEGESIPTAPADPFDPEIERIRIAMLAARNKRFRPGTDTKLITAWNGMAIRALAEASRSFGRDDYRDAAIACAAFIRTNLDHEGQLYRTWDGSNPRIAGFLEDHAHLVDGLTALYQATFDIAWLDWAIDLTQRMIVDFSDDRAATFFDTSAAHDQLMVRIRDLQDGATPCGNSVAWGVLLKLGNLTGNQAWIDRATGSLAGMARYLEGQPLGFGRFLVAATESIGVVREVAIATNERNITVDAFAGAVYTRFEPNALVALVEPDAISRIPWLADRPVRNGQTTAYLCEQFVCLPPVTNPADLTAQLEMGTGMSWSSF